jgi:post-segregation antitoxin (ccd killing protein)
MAISRRLRHYRNCPIHPVERNGDGMTKIQIELPDATAEAAQAAGLLTSEALDRLLSNALRRRQAADWLMGIADELATAGVSPLSEAEIQAEVRAAREARRHRAAGD